MLLWHGSVAMPPDWAWLEQMGLVKSAAWDVLTMLLFKPFHGAFKQARRGGHGC